MLRVDVEKFLEVIQILFLHERRNADARLKPRLSALIPAYSYDAFMKRKEGARPTMEDVMRRLIYDAKSFGIDARAESRDITPEFLRETFGAHFSERPLHFSDDGYYLLDSTNEPFGELLDAQFNYIYLLRDVNEERVTDRIVKLPNKERYENNSDILTEAKNILAIQEEGAIPGIAQLVEIGLVESGELYLVFETIRNGVALDIIDDEEEEIPLDILWNGFIEAAEALRRLHQRRWLHNDIKPANLLLNDSGTMQFIDFDSMVPTGTRSALGTNHFMPRDLIRREDSDIYSFIRTILAVMEAQLKIAEDPVMNRLVKEVLKPYYAWVRGPRRNRPDIDTLIRQLEEDAVNLGIEIQPEQRSVNSRIEQINSIIQNYLNSLNKQKLEGASWKYYHKNDLSDDLYLQEQLFKITESTYLKSNTPFKFEKAVDLIRAYDHFFVLQDLSGNAKAFRSASAYDSRQGDLLGVKIRLQGTAEGSTHYIAEMIRQLAFEPPEGVFMEVSGKPKAILLKNLLQRYGEKREWIPFVIRSQFAFDVSDGLTEIKEIDAIHFERKIAGLAQPAIKMLAGKPLRQAIEKLGIFYEDLYATPEEVSRGAEKLDIDKRSESRSARELGLDMSPRSETRRMALEEQIYTLGVYRYLTDKLEAEFSLEYLQADQYQAKILFRSFRVSSMLNRDHLEQTIDHLMEQIQTLEGGRYRVHSPNFGYGTDHPRTVQISFFITVSEEKLREEIETILAEEDRIWRVMKALAGHLLGNQISSLTNIEFIKPGEEKQEKYLKAAMLAADNALQKVNEIFFDSGREFYLSPEDDGRYIFITPNTPAYKKSLKLNDADIKKIDRVMAVSGLGAELREMLTGFKVQAEEKMQFFKAGEALSEQDIKALYDLYLEFQILILQMGSANSVENFKMLRKESRQKLRSESRRGQPSPRAALNALLSDPEKINDQMALLLRHHFGNRWVGFKHFEMLQDPRKRVDEEHAMRTSLSTVEEMRYFIDDFSVETPGKVFLFDSRGILSKNLIATRHTQGYKILPGFIELNQKISEQGMDLSVADIKQVFEGIKRLTERGFLLLDSSDMTAVMNAVDFENTARILSWGLNIIEAELSTAKMNLKSFHELTPYQVSRLVKQMDAVWDGIFVPWIRLVAEGKTRDTKEIKKVERRITRIANRSESRQGPVPALNDEMRRNFAMRAQALPLAWERYGTHFLIHALSYLLGEAVYSERAGIRPPVPEEIFKRHFGEGRIITTAAYEKVVNSFAGTSGRVVIDPAWIKTFINQSPRALYVLLKALQEVTRDEPLLAVLGDNLSEEIAKALGRKGDHGDVYDQNNLTPLEKADAREHLLPNLARLITFIDEDRLPEYMEANQFGVTALFANAGEIPESVEAGAFILDPSAVPLSHLMSIAFMLPSLLKGAVKIRGIPVAAERIRELQEDLQEIVPGAKPNGRTFDIDFRTYVLNALIATHLVDVAA